MNRHSCLGGAASAVFLLAISITSPQADAAQAAAGPMKGCLSKTILKADTMVYDHFEPKWFTRNPADYYQERIVVTTKYRYCPNGPRPDKVKVMSASWCYTHLDGRPLQFDGFKGNAFYADGGMVTDPPTAIIPDNGEVQNCVKQDMRPHAPRWLRLRYHAGWKATAFYVRDKLPDESLVFKDEKGQEYHVFNPAADLSLGDWK